MAEEDSERSEEPTQQRREDFRKRGEVAQTRELSSMLVLLVSALLIWGLGRYFLVQITDLYRLSFTDYLIRAARNGEYFPAAIYAIKQLLLLVAPVAGVLMVVGLASSYLQVGWLVNEEALQIKFERLNPVSGFQKIFSLRSFVEGFKSILKMVLIGGVVALLVKSEVDVVPMLGQLSVEELFVYFGDVTLRLLAGVGGLMGALAGLDYLFLRWDLEKRMRMTKQEVREEHKSREGDPLIKARIRRIQREMANKRMMEEVPKADVVITNPTHLAIAIRYDDTMVAPKVVAKGADRVAARIREIARANGIPLVENKPLARAIFKSIKVGQTIPRELYKAVAEVLAYVFRLKRKGRLS